MSEQFVKDSGILLSRRKPVKTQAEGMAGKFLMKLTVTSNFIKFILCIATFILNIVLYHFF